MGGGEESVVTTPEAADEFVKVEEQLAKLKPRRETARKVLLEHFRKTERTTYKGSKGTVTYSKSTQRRLDQERVKRYLGAKLSRFLKPVTIETIQVQ